MLLTLLVLFFVIIISGLVIFPFLNTGVFSLFIPLDLPLTSWLLGNSSARANSSPLLKRQIGCMHPIKRWAIGPNAGQTFISSLSLDRHLCYIHDPHLVVYQNVYADDFIHYNGFPSTLKDVHIVQLLARS